MPPASSCDCPHLDCVGEITKEELIQKSNGHCQDCKVRGPNLWACLENGCAYVGCGESHADHSTVHSQETRHNLTVNLTTLRVWCYACGKEVFLERKLGPHSPNAIVEPLPLPQNDVQDNSKAPGSPSSLKLPSHVGYEDLDMETEEEDNLRARGLTGLKNIGNTCYMNAALQALSNCPPLTQFFLECGGLVKTDKKPALCKSYQKLVSDLWHKNRPSYVVPTNLFQGIKAINPMFRGYSQQSLFGRVRGGIFICQWGSEDPEPSDLSTSIAMDDSPEEDNHSQSDNDFQSCESCGSSERADNEVQGGSIVMDNTNEAEMLIPEQDEIQANREWQKEKNMINDLYRSGFNGVMGGNNGDIDKDVDTTTETMPIISSQGALKDSQEFLRCLMDQLHEELKESVPEPSDLSTSITMDDSPEEDNHSQSDNDFQSCESCGSSERADNEVQGGSIVMDNTNEAEMLIPEQDEIQANREWQKEKNMINDLYRSGFNGVMGGNNGDIDKDVDTTTETMPIISSQGALKVQGRTSDFFSDIQMSNITRPQSPVAMEGHIPKISSSPPKATSGWLSLNPAHKKAVTTFSPLKNKRQRKYRSVISDVFDGTIVSSVQCLTCDRVSVTLENFQDISLPIPGKEDLAKLHSASHQTSLVKAGSCGEAYAAQGWIAFVMEYIRSWFWGPVVTLQDCLAAFFARDELKGDNMYSCEKCKKLRNGVKFCKMQNLPEILCIHLKRFRHELMYSTKIGTHVSFPLEGLDLQPFLAKDSSAQTTSYDLLSVICHHGTASSGHYIAYCRNSVNNLWYEFDDQSVTEVPELCVQNAEAYVLFYKKSSEDAVKERRRVSGLLSMMEPSLLQFYVSRQWLNKFKTFAEPGPISNDDFLCVHGGVPPNKSSYIDDLVVMLPQNVWDHLYSRYGGGPAVNHLYVCHTCQIEIEKLEKRLKSELDLFVRLNKAFQEEESPVVIYCISMQWFREWEGFVKGKDNDPPGPIDNSKIAVNKNGHFILKQGADSGQISEETWNFLHSIYGGGPLVMVRPSVSHQEAESSQSEEKIEVETRSV